MIILLQAAAQHLPVVPPPIHVTVDKFPIQPGLSEWQKTLLSAGVGAVFGILGSLAVEYVKPFIAKKLMKRLIFEEIFTSLAKVSSLGMAA